MAEKKKEKQIINHLYIKCLQFVNDVHTLLMYSHAHDFSPRLDNNNAWRPVGRGDPLKNDPTYDYSPPTLDRVRYWAETNNTASETNKTNADESLQTYAVAERLASMGLTRMNTLNNNLQKNGKGEVPLLQPKYLAMRRSYYAPQLSTHLMPPPMQTIPTAMKPDYQHNMLNYNTETTMPFAKHSSTMSWTHNMRTQPPAFDNHFQESVNYMHFVRPNTATPAQQQQFFSPNSIRPAAHALKQTAPPRKPWLQELLQKEIVKVPKTTVPDAQSQHNIGISTTQQPLASLPTSTSTYTPTTTLIAATKTTLMPAPLTSSTAQAQSTPLAKTTRLIIPNESNMLHRPTVAPLRLTTDSLFKNYNQADLPLTGPMYLIIEGHSKVKTYGKDELDPHKPKIVPIVPKREPIVRVADPNERRGTIETYQVRHLHTVTTTTPMTTTSTATTKTAKPVTETTTSTPTTTTTAKDNLAQNLTDVPPTGAQGLLNFLDSFFGGEEITTTKPSTKLQMLALPEKNLSTVEYQRGVRQIFDYDMLPDSRGNGDEASLELLGMEQNPITEINTTVVDGDDDDDDDEDETVEEVSEHHKHGQEILSRIDDLWEILENEESDEEVEQILLPQESPLISSRKA